jgi:hypothetical protein
MKFVLLLKKGDYYNYIQNLFVKEMYESIIIILCKHISFFSHSSLNV